MKGHNTAHSQGNKKKWDTCKQPQVDVIEETEVWEYITWATTLNLYVQRHVHSASPKVKSDKVRMMHREMIEW